jgi:hypothetical protein
MNYLDLKTHTTRHVQADDRNDAPIPDDEARVPKIFVGLGGNQDNILDPGFCFYVMDLEDLRKLAYPEPETEAVTLYSYRGTQHTYEKDSKRVSYYTIWTVWQCQPEAGKPLQCVDSQGRAVQLRHETVRLVYLELKDEKDNV